MGPRPRLFGGMDGRTDPPWGKAGELRSPSLIQQTSEQGETAYTGVPRPSGRYGEDKSTRRDLLVHGLPGVCECGQVPYRNDAQVDPGEDISCE